MVLARSFRALRPRRWEPVEHLQPRSDGFEEALAVARQDLGARCADGRLARDASPRATAFWVDDQHEGRPHRTAGLVVALRADAPGGDAVLPHERTFPEPVARRVLTRNALRVESTPTLVVLREAVPSLQQLLDAADGTPLVHVDAAGARHHALPVDLPEDVVEDLRGVPALVADGHHRIAAALAPEALARGTVLAWLVDAASAPRLHPVHRTVRDLPSEALVRLDAAGIAREPAPARPDPSAPVLVTAEGAWRLVAAPGGEAAAALARGHAAVRDLPSALVALALHDVLGIGTSREHLGTTIDAAAAVAGVGAGEHAAAVLACGPDLEQVWAAAEAGVLLPAKATWFAPKPVAGAVLRPLGQETTPGKATADRRSEGGG